MLAEKWFKDFNLNKSGYKSRQNLDLWLFQNPESNIEPVSSLSEQSSNEPFLALKFLGDSTEKPQDSK